MFILKVLISYGFKVLIMLCDGVLLNFIVLKFFFGYFKVQFFVRFDVEIFRECYYVDVLFINLEDLLGNFIFLMICLSYQVCIMCILYCNIFVCIVIWVELLFIVLFKFRQIFDMFQRLQLIYFCE